MNLEMLFWVILAAAGITGLYLKWIRPWQLRWGATDEELTRAMPGDEDVPSPSFDATRGVTVHAPPEAIYPWIVQIGMTRAGWYSYDLLDNLGRPSARRLLPEHQQIYVGQLIPMSPDGKYGVYVKDFRANEWILWNDKEDDTTWFWGLYPERENRTRLVTRLRMKYRWNSPAALFNLLVEFGDLPMMRKCLLGIKERAKNLSRHPG
ncbi:MAG: hypothetical protein AB1894_18100 [Chloroflexota bacterium]